jgi:predicted dinucleotide-binding enzyme
MRIDHWPSVISTAAPLPRRAILHALAGLGSLIAGLPTLAQSRPVAPLRIGIVGAGSLGGTVGRAWVRAGHEVMFSSRNPDSLGAMVRQLGPRASVGSAGEAAAFGTVVLFAVPYTALPELGRDLQAQLRGKVVLDACNPAPGTDNALSRESVEKGVGSTSAKYLPGTRLVRVFSAVDASAIATSSGGVNEKLGVPLAGDDAAAVQIAAQLVRDSGCEPVVVGNLAAAQSFQRGGPGFRANTNAPALRRLLGLG